MNLLLIERSEIVDGAITITGVRAEHVAGVLRLAVGDRLRLGIVDGEIGTAAVRAIHGGPRIELDDLVLEPAPALPSIDLLLALPRPKVLARLLSPIAQLGVRRIFLSGAWKVERFYFDAHVLQPEELRAHLLEGLSQVKDTRLPVVTVHRSLTFLVRDELTVLVPENAVRLVCDPRGAPLEAVASAAPTVLAIGPEGGFTEREDRLLEAHGFRPASLGARTLRSDVAVIAALSRLAATR